MKGRQPKRKITNWTKEGPLRLQKQSAGSFGYMARGNSLLSLLYQCEIIMDKRIAHRQEQKRRSGDRCRRTNHHKRSRTPASRLFSWFSRCQQAHGQEAQCCNTLGIQRRIYSNRPIDWTMCCTYCDEESRTTHKNAKQLDGMEPVVLGGASRTFYRCNLID